jgi:hypothetical protein
MARRLARSTMKAMFVVVVALLPNTAVMAEPTFQLDPTSKRVVSISNLYNDPTCDPRQFRGKVVKRQFEEDQVTVEGFVLEHPDGSRDFIGVNLDGKGLSLNTSGWIIRGLQTLLAEGHVVDVTVKFCGVSGHFVMLDAVREVPPWEH